MTRDRFATSYMRHYAFSYTIQEALTLHVWQLYEQMAGSSNFSISETTFSLVMPRSHIHGFDAGLATDTILHHPCQSVLVRICPYCICNHT